MISLEKAIKFPFTQKDWQTKLGILFLLSLAISLISSAVNVDTEIQSQVISNALTKTRFSTDFRPILDSIKIYKNLWMLPLQLIMFPVSLYISGYIFSFTGNVMRKKTVALDEHKDILKHLKLGLMRFLLSLPITIITAIILGIFLAVALVVTFATGLNSLSSPAEIILMLTVWFVFAILTFILAFTTGMLNSSVFYNYLKSGDFWKSLSLRTVIETFKKAWKDFLVVIGFQFIIGIAGLLVGLTLICFSFIVQPLLTLYIQLVVAHLYGQVFQKLGTK